MRIYHTNNLHLFTIASVTLPLLANLPASGQVINEHLKITESDGARYDSFGLSMAIDSGTLAVGKPYDGPGSGSVYLFDATTGIELFKLVAEDELANDRFGTAIAIDNGIVAIGAAHIYINEPRFSSAYLFDAATGTQLFKLLPDDGEPDDQFGTSIDIDNGIVAIGAKHHAPNGPSNGAAYLFDALTGKQLFKLLPSDGSGGDLFGTSIAIDNGIVAVGSFHDNNENGLDSGSAYLFDASTGEQIAKILPSDGWYYDMFGVSIAIDDGVVAVGSYYDGDNGDNSGSAYLFDAYTGEQIAKLLPEDGASDDWFGYSIAINDGVVVVGAWRDDDNGSDSGSAYLFDASTGMQIAKLIPSDGAGQDRFSHSSIAINNGIVAVGSPLDDPNGINSGSAYLFTVPTLCRADLTNDNTLNFTDVSAFLKAFNNNDPIADFTNDGLLNFFDISAFLQAFVAGCP